MLATPITFDTTAIREVPEPDAILHTTQLSDTQACVRQLEAACSPLTLLANRTVGLIPINEKCLPSRVMLLAPDAGPHPKTNAPEIDPVA